MNPKVSNGTFDGLKTITILSLRKNFIEELGASVFTDLVRVEELDLGQVPQSSYTSLSLRPGYSFESHSPQISLGQLSTFSSSCLIHLIKNPHDF